MDNYIALLLLVVPGFISRKIYGYLVDLQPTKDNFEETTYSLIFSAFNILGIYIIFYFVSWYEGNVELLTKANIINSFNNPRIVAIYAVMAFLSSVLIAFIWKMLYPYYIKFINYFRKKSGQNELSMSDSVFYDSFNDGKMHWVEICKDGKVLARGVIVRMDKENGEYYLLDAEGNFQQVTDTEGKIRKYKGYYFDAKNNIFIREVDFPEI